MDVGNANSLKRMIELYIKNISTSTKDKVSELEVRFGIFEPAMDDRFRKDNLSKKAITRIDFDNVVKTIRASGFVLEESLEEPAEQYYLRITEAEPIKQTGKKEWLKSSNTRLEIRGLDLIQKYCMYNDIQKIMDDSLERAKNMMKFTQKMAPLMNEADAGSMIQPVKFSDYNYRVSYKMEEDFQLFLPKSKESIKNWQNVKKTFRFIKRYRFSHPTLPVFIDMSIVKTNQKDRSGQVLIPTYTIQQANVFNNPDHYEIEIELSNKGLGATSSSAVGREAILQSLRKGIHIVLSGLQSTNFPLSYVEQDHVLVQYMNLIHMEKTEKYNGRSIRPTDFFGPSSETLQIENLLQKSKINVLSNYSVTDKADGERKMLFVCPSAKYSVAKIYLIDMNMNVAFTGKTTLNKDLYGTLIDGEHILYDKTGNYINQYMAFDIYFTHQQKKTGDDADTTQTGMTAVRNYKFIRLASDDKKEKYRYTLLKQRIRELNASLSQTDKCSFLIDVKDFYIEGSLFENCSAVLNNSEFLRYNTDGLIFTPCHLGIPIDPRNGFRATWNQSFKWKPAEYNTIDFYVSCLKDKNGACMIKSNFTGGQDFTNMDMDTPYKVIELRCGYNKNDKRHKNPYNDVLQLAKGELAGRTQNYEADNDAYNAELFKATYPFDPLSYLCFVPMQRDDSNKWVMKTEEGDVFDEKMIVEFKYDLAGDYPANPWRWKPIRLRNDKTAKLLSGQKEYGNAFHVANNNWHSIHSPVSKDILMTGNNIPKDDIEIYYDNNPESKKNNTKSLRIFHNIVKSRLINVVSHLNANKTMIDYAVGKGGDLKKWIHSGLEFVFGIDIFRDNIVNERDGACVRYLQDYEQNMKSPFRAVFVVGDSSQHIRSGDAVATPQEKDITRSLFATVGQQYDFGKKYNGIAKNGFQISSCQFAIHYFFKNQNTLHGFLRNVAECTQLGGYFIGTTYDGQLVFDQLKKYKKDEGIVLTRENADAERDVVFKITKSYDETGFPSDENSLGYTISVFQDSIGKAMDEYLVNFEYFERLMATYGFALFQPAVESGQPKKGEFKRGTGLFKDIYADMVEELKQNPHLNEYKKATEMKEDEKFISFLNRYFIFKKVNEVDTANLFKNIFNQAAKPTVEVVKEAPKNLANEVVKEKKKATKAPAKKIRDNFVMKDFKPIEE